VGVVWVVAGGAWVRGLMTAEERRGAPPSSGFWSVDLLVPSDGRRKERGSCWFTLAHYVML
jgi:hypothetical protein